MKTYEIIAARRSGHHSILNWIIRNQTFLQCTWNYKFNIIGNGFAQLNEANLDQDQSINYLNNLPENMKVLYIGYEDTKWDFTILNSEQRYFGDFRTEYENITKIDNRIIVIRDFFSSITSRVKKFETRVSTGETEKEVQKTMNIKEEYIELWKNHAKGILEGKISGIKFEDWLDDPEIRKDFLYRNFGINEVWGIDGIVGTESSFNKLDHNVKNRFDPNLIPENVKTLIKKDDELYYLIGALGYPYRKL